MTFESHPVLGKAAPLEKLLDGLTEEPARQELEDLVRQLSNVDPNVSFEVTLPKERVFPEIHPDFSTLKTRNESVAQDIKEQIIELTAWCRQYLRRPMITDTFPDHAARRAWFTNPPADADTMRRYLPYHQANKLRYNNISNLVQKIIFLNLLLNPRRGGVEWDQREQVLEMLARFPNMEDYEDLNDPIAKRARIQEVDAFCEKVLDFFSK